jgi:hypothetical protein
MVSAMNPKTVFYRIYSDFFLPSRLGEYERLLSSALDAGYDHQTISGFYSILTRGAIKPGTFIFLHRHDIDTDVSTAAKFFSIEKKYGVRASYYFRLKTADAGLMKDIAAYGSEVGYHYEELARYAKDTRIRTKEGMMEHLPAIRERFLENLRRLEAGLGVKVKSVASHGDFVNRILGIANTPIVDDDVRQKAGIMVECYDEKLVSGYSAVISDAPYPLFYKNGNPLQAVEERLPVIYLLTHPRHWRANPGVNIADNVKRLFEGLCYKFPSAR